MSGFQQISIIGNLGQDPEMKYTPDGKAVTTMSVAVNLRNDKVLWCRVTAWEKLAESCNQYLSKGRQIHVIGEIKPDDSGNPRVWTANDGTPRASFEITARNVTFLGKSDGTSRTQESAEPASGIPW